VWLQRTAQGPAIDAGPGITQLLHLATGRLHAGRGRHHEALKELRAAEHLQVAVGGLARAGEPGDRLDAGHPGTPRAGRPSPRRA
jgi:hypothetical protein